MNDAIEFKPNTFEFLSPPSKIWVVQVNNKKVICIDREGRLFWHGREVETDDDFRAAMLELRDYFIGKR